MPKLGSGYKGNEGEVESPDGKRWKVKWLDDGSLRVVGLIKAPKQSSVPPKTKKPPSKPKQSGGSGRYSQTITFNYGQNFPSYSPGYGHTYLFDPGFFGEIPEYEGKEDPIFRSRLSSVMTDNMYDRQLRNRKRGKLDMHHLHRAKLGATNLFTQKQARKGKKYNIVLCVDESGSMKDGTRNVEAANCAAFLAQHFNKLNLDIAIIGFSNKTKLYKDFNKELTNDELIKLHQDIAVEGGGGTNDVEAMKESFDLLIRRQKTHERNFIIFISDGESDSFGVISQMIRQNSEIADVFGVGIQHVCKQIPKNKTVNSVDELKPVIIDYLKQKIRRG